MPVRVTIRIRDDLGEEGEAMPAIDPSAAAARIEQVRLVGALVAQLESPGARPPLLTEAEWSGDAADAYRRGEQELRSALVAAEATAREALRAVTAALAEGAG